MNSRFLHIVMALMLLLTGCGEQSKEVAPGMARGPATHVGRQVCAECHETQTALHKGSDHDLAMAPATPETVLADFDDTSFTHAGITSTFSRRDGAFIVRTDGPDGEMREYPIAYTFGVRPLQQYLIETEEGRFQTLGVSWDTRPKEDGGQRWFHVYGDEPIDHEDELHWTKPLQNWNFMCADCHSTNLKKGYVASEDRFETTWSEIDVSCEACHGPGSAHVEWARLDRLDEIPAGSDMGLTVRLRVPEDAYWTFDDGEPTARRAQPLAGNAQIDTCARCHSRSAKVWGDYQHGAPLSDTHRVAMLDEGLYFADGQILDEVYVHGSFLQSKMHRNGVVCTDCHDPHAVRPQAKGNALCAKCHRSEVFDTPEHHFHQTGSTGAQCVECHMPERTYMVIDPRRDHSIRIPRPDLTIKIGAPNACNRCHEDQSARWASERVIEWYGPERSDSSHYGEAIHGGRRGLPGAGAELLNVIGDDESPAIVRATALELLRDYPGEGATTAIMRAVKDNDPLVRRAGAGMLETLPPETALAMGESLLSDPVRTVRLEAAITLAGLLRENREAPGAFDRAVEEYRTAQRFNADRPESHLNLGNLEARLGNLDASERAYRDAITLDPGFAPASVNLADLLRATGRDGEGERVLRASLDYRESADAHHALGLALIRTGQAGASLTHLEAAARLAPERPRYVFVYAIAAHDLGDAPLAIEILEQALEQHPGDRNMLGALIAYCQELGRQQDAERWAERLEALEI